MCRDMVAVVCRETEVVDRDSHSSVFMTRCSRAVTVTVTVTRGVSRLTGRDIPHLGQAR